MKNYNISEELKEYRKKEIENKKLNCSHEELQTINLQNNLLNLKLSDPNLLKRYWTRAPGDILDSKTGISISQEWEGTVRQWYDSLLIPLLDLTAEHIRKYSCYTHNMFFLAPEEICTIFSHTFAFKMQNDLLDHPNKQKKYINERIGEVFSIPVYRNYFIENNVLFVGKGIIEKDNIDIENISALEIKGLVTL